MPPFVRRCPECGHVGPSRGFAPVEDSVVECPACGTRFGVVDSPWLN